MTTQCVQLVQTMRLDHHELSINIYKYEVLPNHVSLAN